MMTREDPRQAEPHTVYRADECCNSGTWADDGDGHRDFMPVTGTCPCLAPAVDRWIEAG